MILAALILLSLTSCGAAFVAVRRPHNDHLATGLLVTLAAACAAFSLPTVEYPLPMPAQVLVYVTVTVIAVAGGGPLVRSVLAAGWVSGKTTGPTDDAGPLRGGRIIGYLERAAVCATLLAGWPEGMAVILAVKSLARYPELRAPHASEQFIMGTFTSVLWACALSGIGYLALH